MKRLLGFILLFVFIAVPVRASAYPLTPQVPMTVGGDLHLVRIADMDNDGNNDIIVTDGKQIRGFAVLFGNGNGTFSSPVLVGDGDSYEWGIDIVDMNNDGLKDVVVTNGALDTLQISLNTGARTFAPAVNYPIGQDINSESSVSSGDFDGDGNQDLAVAGQGGSVAFHVFMGGGSGVVSVSSDVLSNDPQFYRSDVEIIDYDGDSILDVITTDNSVAGDIEFFKGDGAGGFLYDYSLSDLAARSFTLADIDGDNVDDIVYSQSGAGVFVIKQDGSPITSFPASQVELVEVSDINVDGNVDIVFSDGSVPGIQVAISSGGGSFDTLAPYSVSYDPLGIAFGDLDGDSLPDVVAVNHGEVLSVFLTDPPTTPGVLINGSPVAAEGGASGYFDISLSSNPDDVVVVELYPSNSQVALPKSGACFVSSGQSVYPGTPYDPCTTWNIGQPMEVQAVDDADLEGTHSDSVVFSVSSGDTKYNGFAVSDLPVTVYDNETSVVPGINYSTGGGSNSPANISESGSTDTINLTLNGIPSENVTVTCTPSDGYQIGYTPNPISFIYSPVSANTAQSIDLSAIDDIATEGIHNVIMNCATSSQDTYFNNLSVDISINIEDNDNTVDTDSDGDPDTTDPDDDGDGTIDVVEDGAANSGDGDQDGILDSLQKTVTSAPNSLTGEYMTFVISGECSQIQMYATNSEDQNIKQDEAYGYPIGFNSFTVKCGEEGASVNVRWILDREYDTYSWVYRKYLPSTQEYINLSGVYYDKQVIAGIPRTTVNYRVTDGSSYDTDGEVDASISDPNGPAINLVQDNLASTGQPSDAVVLLSSLVIFMYAACSMCLATKFRY